MILQVAFGLRMKGYAFLAWIFFGVALECTGWWARVALWQNAWNYAAMIASLTGLIIGESASELLGDTFSLTIHRAEFHQYVY